MHAVAAVAQLAADLERESGGRIQASVIIHHLSDATSLQSALIKRFEHCGLDGAAAVPARPRLTLALRDRAGAADEAAQSLCRGERPIGFSQLWALMPSHRWLLACSPQAELDAESSWQRAAIALRQLARPSGLGFWRLDVQGTARAAPTVLLPWVYDSPRDECELKALVPRDSGFTVFAVSNTPAALTFQCDR